MENTNILSTCCRWCLLSSRVVDIRAIWCTINVLCGFKNGDAPAAAHYMKACCMFTAHWSHVYSSSTYRTFHPFPALVHLPSSNYINEFMDIGFRWVKHFSRRYNAFSAGLSKVRSGKVFSWTGAILDGLLKRVEYPSTAKAAASYWRYDRVGIAPLDIVVLCGLLHYQGIWAEQKVRVNFQVGGVQDHQWLLLSETGQNDVIMDCHLGHVSLFTHNVNNRHHRSRSDFSILNAHAGCRHRGKRHGSFCCRWSAHHLQPLACYIRVLFWNQQSLAHEQLPVRVSGRR